MHLLLSEGGQFMSIVSVPSCARHAARAYLRLLHLIHHPFSCNVLSLVSGDMTLISAVRSVGAGLRREQGMQQALPRALRSPPT